MSRPLSATVYGKIRYAINGLFKKLRKILISACRKHVVARQGPPHLRLETISDRSGPCPVCENLRLSLPSPAETWTGGSRRNQLRRGHGSPPVLSEVPHELSIPMRTPKSANGPRSNSFRPDSPLTTTFNQGRKTQPAPSPHRTWSVPDASSQPQLNLQFTVTVLVYENLRILSLFLPLLSCIMKMGYGQEKLMGC